MYVPRLPIFVSSASRPDADERELTLVDCSPDYPLGHHGYC
jgi:hypothetical protein